jgi:hypothetical protein
LRVIGLLRAVVAGGPCAEGASDMAIQDLPLFSLSQGRAYSTISFADPEWRGDASAADLRLRPLSDIKAQIARLNAWIVAGSDYGWLGAYQAKRAAFELQSIRAHLDHEADGDGQLADLDRQAVQSRLDRLEGCLDLARAGSA